MTTKPRTKRGGASIFVVLITIILFGVITLGYLRLMLSEANQTTNSDLSQSAYDSALAGVEDAKLALLKYHECLNNGATTQSTGECGDVIRAMQKGIKNGDCDTVAAVLGRTVGEDGGVLIQETRGESGEGNSNDMAQAYTCVKISEELPDYRTTLNDTDRLRVIPLRVEDVNQIKAVKVSWYSSENAESVSSAGIDPEKYNASSLPSGEDYPTPPLLGVSLLQADATFLLSDFYASYGTGERTDRATVYLAPSQSGEKELDKAAMAKTNDKSSQNQPVKVQCSKGEFYCSFRMELPDSFRASAKNQGASFLLITLPYGNPATDVSVELCTNLKCRSDEILPFVGVQARVDSTGRANDLYRRVESRVELVDVYYPYPEFAIQLNGKDSDSLKKNFYVTYNCWTAQDTGNNTSSVSQCNNSRDL